MTVLFERLFVDASFLYATPAKDHHEKFHQLEKKRFPKLASVKSIPRKNIQENENYAHLLDCVKDFGKTTLVENGVEKQIFDEKTLDYVVSILSVAPNRKKAYKVALNLFTKATRAILCGQRIDLDAHTLHYASLFLSAALSDDFQKSLQ